MNPENLFVSGWGLLSPTGGMSWIPGRWILIRLSDILSHANLNLKSLAHRANSCDVAFEEVCSAHLWLPISSAHIGTDLARDLILLS